MSNAEPQLSRRSIFKILLGVLALYVSFGAAFYHFVERWSWLDSFYFTVVTLATVGYGDFVPKTDAGKLFTMPYIFIGIGLFIYVANSFLKSRAEQRIEKHKAKKEGEG